MASHEPFGHLKHKLWAKERPGVKLAVWLPTTKSRESTWSRCVQMECNTPLESSWGEIRVCFRPHPNSRFEPGVMSSQSPGSPNRESKPGQFRDSSLGVPGIKTNWMWVPRSNAENTIWGKVVASPESGPWWVKWVQGRSWLVPTPKGCIMSSNQLVGWFWMQDRITK
jgi:hypothetical protein